MKVLTKTLLITSLLFSAVIFAQDTRISIGKNTNMKEVREKLMQALQGRATKTKASAPVDEQLARELLDQAEGILSECESTNASNEKVIAIMTSQLQQAFKAAASECNALHESYQHLGKMGALKTERGDSPEEIAATLKKTKDRCQRYVDLAAQVGKPAAPARSSTPPTEEEAGAAQ